MKEGEYQRANGTYEYRWRAANGRRSSVYAKTLEVLREKEQDIFRDKCDGIRTESKNVTVNDVYDLWRKLKKGLIDVNHTLIYYNHRVGGPAGCYF